MRRILLSLAVLALIGMTVNAASAAGYGRSSRYGHGGSGFHYGYGGSHAQYGPRVTYQPYTYRRLSHTYPINPYPTHPRSRYGSPAYGYGSPAYGYGSSAYGYNGRCR